MGIALGTLALLLVGLIVAGNIYMWQIYGSDGSLNRHRCAEHLMEVGVACQEYARANSGRFPSDFASLVLGGTLSDGDLVCPTATSIGVAPVPSGAVKPQNYSYVYVGSGFATSAPPGVILAYEKIENHEAKGIHVLYADGSVVWLDRREAAHIVDELNVGHNPPQ